MKTLNQDQQMRLMKKVNQIHSSHNNHNNHNLNSKDLHQIMMNNLIDDHRNSKDLFIPSYYKYIII